MTEIIIIAELCQNHNGNFEDVRRMIHEAKASGATHVKIQNIYADMLYFRPQFEKGLEVDGQTLAIKRPFDAEYNRLKSDKINLQIQKNMELSLLATLQMNKPIYLF